MNHTLLLVLLLASVALSTNSGSGYSIPKYSIKCSTREELVVGGGQL